MNRLRNIVGLIAVCATAAFFTGCGDDDDNNGGNNSNAPETLRGRTYNLTDAAGTSTIAFDANGNYALTPSSTNNAVETGTFTETKSGETINAILTNAAGDRTSTLDFTFTGDGQGTYVFTAPGEAPVSGNFALAGDGNTTDTNGNTTEPTTATDGNTTTNPPGDVQAPANLQTITITPANGISAGQTFTVNLNGGNFTAVGTQGQDMGSGTYTYTPSGTTANLHLTYGGTNAGDFDDYNLVFTEEQGSTVANNFTGTQRVSGTDSPINGTFTY
jgi:hypothetical protein